MAKTLNPTAKKQSLSLDTLAGLSNGQALATINAAIRSAVNDVEDREFEVGDVLTLSISEWIAEQRGIEA